MGREREGSSKGFKATALDNEARKKGTRESEVLEGERDGNSLQLGFQGIRGKWNK